MKRCLSGAQELELPIRPRHSVARRFRESGRSRVDHHTPNRPKLGPIAPKLRNVFVPDADLRGKRRFDHPEIPRKVAHRATNSRVGLPLSIRIGNPYTVRPRTPVDGVARLRDGPTSPSSKLSSHLSCIGIPGIDIAGAGSAAAHMRLVDDSYVALPRFPRSQKAGHRPAVSTSPGSVALISMIPPGPTGRRVGGKGADARQHHVEVYRASRRTVTGRRSLQARTIPNRSWIPDHLGPLRLYDMISYHLA